TLNHPSPGQGESLKGTTCLTRPQCFQTPVGRIWEDEGPDCQYRPVYWLSYTCSNHLFTAFAFFGRSSGLEANNLTSRSRASKGISISSSRERSMSSSGSRRTIMSYQIAPRA